MHHIWRRCWKWFRSACRRATHLTYTFFIAHQNYTDTNEDTSSCMLFHFFRLSWVWGLLLYSVMNIYHVEGHNSLLIIPPSETLPKQHIELFVLLTNGIRMWVTYRFQFMVLENTMNPVILFVPLAHHTPNLT